MKHFIKITIIIAILTSFFAIRYNQYIDSEEPRLASIVKIDKVEHKKYSTYYYAIVNYKNSKQEVNIG